jgi:site-specific DNA-methyltransferase (adenine-specific)
MIIAYQDHLVTLYRGDALAGIPCLPSVDAVITDPPYGETQLHWDKWPTGFMQLLAAKTNSVWCFGSLRLFMAQRSEFAGWNLSQEIVWEKHNGSSHARDRFRRVHELAAHFYTGDWKKVYKRAVVVDVEESRARGALVRGNKPAHWNGIEKRTSYHYAGKRLARSVIYSRSCHGYAIHPTQKPEAIIAPLIEYSVPPVGTVLDPFAGSATTLIVARKLGRKAIGIESSAAMVEKAVARLLTEAGRAAA